MVLADSGKLIALILIIVGVFALVLADKATLTDIAPFVTLIVGFLVGNGETALRSKAPSPVIMSSVQPNETVTIHGSYPMEREVDER